jgi:hypothetical protein
VLEAIRPFRWDLVRPDHLGSLLGGALPDPRRLHLLPLSTAWMDGRLCGRLHPAEVAQLRANLTAHGLSPAGRWPRRSRSSKPGALRPSANGSPGP